MRVRVRKAGGLAGLLLVAFVIVFMGYGGLEEPQLSGREAVTLVRLVDGDTANFSTSSYGNVNVRFSGVDTPEVRHPTKGKEYFGDEASAFTASMLNGAERIEIEWDLTQDPSHDRPIGIVWVDGVNLNLLLVREGYADLEYLEDTMPYADDYRAALKEAQAEHKGMWN